MLLSACVAAASATPGGAVGQGALRASRRRRARASDDDEAALGCSEADTGAESDFDEVVKQKNKFPPPPRPAQS